MFDYTELIWADESFRRPDAASVFLAEMPDHDKFLDAKNKMLHRRKSEENPFLLPTYEEPVLTAKQEFHLFRKFNYLKSLTRDAALRRSKKALWYFSEAKKVEKLLALANMRLAVLKAKALFSIDFDGYISNGYAVVWQVVPKFNWTLKWKFSSFCTRAIMNRYIRDLQMEHREFYDRDFTFFQDLPGRERTAVEYAGDNEGYNEILVARLMSFAGLNSSELAVIRMRFGFDGEPMMLKEIGKSLGVGKERARQKTAKALEKMRAYLTAIDVHDAA